MTFKYNNVYINETSLVAGPYEEKGPLSKTFDKTYKDLYMGEQTWEQAETKILKESVEILLNKLNKKTQDIKLHISGDLLNQITATNYAASKLKIPLLGIYSACATSVQGLITAANMIEANQIENCICSTSSHNNAAEKQFRYPVEYGAPKSSRSTFTTTGGASAYLSKEKKGIKVESGTIGIVSELGFKDVNHMGAIMAPSAGDVLNIHLKDLNRTIEYYDLILTGDLGTIGLEILKEYTETSYGLKLKNIKDSGTLIFDLKDQPVNAGGGGAACLPLVTYGHIFEQIKQNQLKKVLLIATGALFSPTMAMQKLGLPSISHAISLEVIP